MKHPSKTLGYIPDIYGLLGKYSLIQYFHNNTFSAVFPPNRDWKRTVKPTVLKHANFEYKTRFENDAALSSFLSIHIEILPCNAWRFSQLYRDYLPYCRTIVFVVSHLYSHDYIRICPVCRRLSQSVVYHVLLFCPINVI
jgi:uncharacterized membrane protein YesL